MEKGVKVDPRSGLVTTFESLVDLKVLLDWPAGTGQKSMESHGCSA